MRIILDENIPRPLLKWFALDEVTTVQKEGWAGVKNGELIARLDGLFDVFVTADKNLRYQQNLSGRTIAILELPTNRLPLLISLKEPITAALKKMGVSDYMVIEPNA